MDFSFNTLVFILFVIYSIAQALLAEKKRKEKLAQANQEENDPFVTPVSSSSPSAASSSSSSNESAESPFSNWRALVQELDQAMQQELALIEEPKPKPVIQDTPARTPKVVNKSVDEFRKVVRPEPRKIPNLELADMDELLNKPIEVVQLSDAKEDQLFDAKGLNLRDFKRGVIMKEILDRPLALRETPQRYF